MRCLARCVAKCRLPGNRWQPKTPPGQCMASRIYGNGRPLGLTRKWFIQIEFTGIRQSKRRISDDWLTQRRRLENGRYADQIIRTKCLRTENSGCRGSTLGNAEGYSWNPESMHEVGNLRLAHLATRRN